ncbi:uncharacterized protein LOC144119201 [Amblyomma americanum]
MIEEENIPFPFQETGWSEDFSRCSVRNEHVWQYLHSATSNVRQAHRGWSFKEEGYVKNLKVNLETADDELGLMRAACAPSMKTGVYVTTTWFVVGTGHIVGAHCDCVAGLSETCQHVAGLLFSAAARAEDAPSCTNVLCKWIVPAEAKKAARRKPLVEIKCQKYCVNKPPRGKRKRDYDPCPITPLPTPHDIESLRKKLASACPDLQALRYLCPTNKAKTRPPCNKKAIEDTDDLWSEPSATEVQSYMQTLKPLSREERHDICEETVAQAANKWHAARVGRLTASLFKRICRCTKPDGLLKELLYPCNRATSEAIAYGREHEADAVEAYVKLQHAKDLSVAVQETGLHVHNQYPFIAASPDRIVVLDGEEGLLEVKCPFSKKGMACEEACLDKHFCCRLTEDGVELKRDHAYFYQIQGQMAVTGHNWCDLVIWTEVDTPEDPPYLYVERIQFNEEFWNREQLPGLLHFSKHALIPEILTRRVKKLGRLYTSGTYVSHSKFRQGYYVCTPLGGLRIKIKKLK